MIPHDLDEYDKALISLARSEGHLSFQHTFGATRILGTGTRCLSFQRSGISDQRRYLKYLESIEKLLALEILIMKIPNFYHLTSKGEEILASLPKDITLP